MAIYKVTARATAGGQQIRNVFHVSAAVDEATPDEIAGSFRTAWQTNVLPLFHASYTFQGVDVEEQGGSGDLGFAPATVTPGGQSSTGPLATFVVASVRLKTARAGRAGQGRTGLGPIPSGRVSGNSLNEDYRLSVVGSMNNFRTNIASSGGNGAMLLMVRSGVEDGIERVPPIYTVVTGIDCNALVGTRLSRHARTS